jgi:hypothetical protein
MRTLVIGIPLPHVTFDNYSFISAPAFSDYQQMIVEMLFVSTVIEEVVAGEREHRDFAGHPVHNAPSTAAAFSLQQLLQMRRREAEWFFDRGGVLVCFAHPDVAHPGIAGVCGWRRYSWLPVPPGFSYEQHLLPGFGTPGADVSDEEHAFAQFVTDFAPRLAYRATIDETAPDFSDYGRVFARRTTGGAAIATELTVGSGRIVLLPPILKPETDRPAVAQALFTSLERFGSTPEAS